MTETASPTPLSRQLARRKPLATQTGPHAGPELSRSFGTFQLMMFGVGATVGTGIFFVLQEAVPDAVRRWSSRSWSRVSAPGSRPSATRSSPAPSR